MEISPIASESFGRNPNILLISGTTPTKNHDNNQEVLMGIERKGLTDLFKSYDLDFTITFLVKCCHPKNTPSPKNIRECSKWLIHEEQSKFKIGLGSLVKKYYKCDEYLPALSKLFESQKNIDLLKNILEKYKNDHTQ